MSAEVVSVWLLSGRNVVIGQLSLKPIENALMEGKPLSSQKGQAEVFFLISDNGDWWILKKFHNPSDLERSYLTRISSLLPKEDSFLCGTKRQILSRGMLHRTMGFHYDRDLDQWLDGTILMPRIVGIDWAALADDIRDGTIRLGRSERITLCKNLTELIRLLEAGRGCHRDLSCGNVFIDTATWQVYLIDFDSFYHPNLPMPKNTTCGTAGYTTHHAWRNGKLEAARTWCEKADRYALALLNSEFLLMDPGTKITGEGGIFDQDELRKQSGAGIDSIITRLRGVHANASQLLEAAIASKSLSSCPSPQEWNAILDNAFGPTIKPPSLADFPNFPPGHFDRMRKKHRPAVSLWPAPSLREMSVDMS